MKNNKSSEIKKEIEKVVSDSNFIEFTIKKLQAGKSKFEKIEKIAVKGDVESIPAASGMYRAKQIYDTICNSTDGEKNGITCDCYLASTTNIPRIRVKNIMLTFKSAIDSKKVFTKKSEYMKVLARRNIDIDSQINMFNEIDTINKEDDKSIYYGVVVYHFSVSGDLEYLSFMFPNSRFDGIELEVKVDNKLFDNKKVIDHSDKPVVGEENLHNPSFKEVLKIKSNN